MKVYHTILATVAAIVMVGAVCGCEEQAKVSKEPAAVESRTETTNVTPEATTTPTATTPTATRPVTTTPVDPNAAAPVDPNAPAPKIVFESVMVDFNDVGPGMRKTQEVKFTNEGKGTLTVKRVDACCGCTLDLTKQTLAPGESGSLKVACTFAARPGAMRRSIYLHSNDPNNPKATISIKANIVRKIDVEPAMLSLFLNKENADCDPITIRSVDGRAFSIKGVNVTAQALEVDFDPTVEAREFVLQPKVHADRLKSGLSGVMEITLTHPEALSAVVQFSALPRYKLSPPQVIVFNAEAGKPLERKLWVLNNYEEPFKIASTSTVNGTIEMLKQSEITNGYQFEVRITPPAQAANKTVFTDTFTVQTDDGETLTIPLRGFYMRK